MARKPDLAADVDGDVTDTPAKSRSYGINHFRILGRMTADPEQRFTQSGKAVVNLGIATNSDDALTVDRQGLGLRLLFVDCPDFAVSQDTIGRKRSGSVLAHGKRGKQK